LQIQEFVNGSKVVESGHPLDVWKVQKHTNAVTLLLFGKSLTPHVQPADKAEQVRAPLRGTTVLSQIIAGVGR
jgi:hypothetical protein